MRILLFLATNFAIVIVLSITLQIFGVEHWLHQNGSDLNLTGLLIISAAFGMIGSFISLAMSKWLAKRSAGVKVIENPSNATEKWLMEVVTKQSVIARIKTPEVGIFPSPQPNAFATGMSRNKSLVAVSQGLLDKMSKDEVEAVVGHEISHVANGDMITLALVQGVVNTFVFFFSRVIGHLVDKAIFKSRGYGPGYFITVIISQIILSILASTIVMWFSRRREFRADHGGAFLTKRSQMIGALKTLQRASQGESDLPKEMAAFGISGQKKTGIKRLFMSHPPIEERIAALEASDHLP